MCFPTKNDHFEVFWGYHHLRKPPFLFICEIWKQELGELREMLTFFAVQMAASKKSRCLLSQVHEKPETASTENTRGIWDQGRRSAFRSFCCEAFQKGCHKIEVTAIVIFCQQQRKQTFSHDVTLSLKGASFLRGEKAKCNWSFQLNLCTIIVSWIPYLYVIQNDTNMRFAYGSCDDSCWDSFFWSQPRITLELIGTTVKLMQVVGLVGMHRPVAKNTRVTWSTDVRFLPARNHPWTLLQDVFLELLLICGCYTYIMWGICNYTCTVYIYRLKLINTCWSNCF